MTDPQRRAIEVSIEVPGSPEEVWAAIATGQGISSWFVPAEVEERAGGAVRHDFGSMGADVGSVLEWDPPRRVVFEGGAAMGRPLAFEWLVEAASGDTCIVRLVNTGFGAGDDWDADYDAMAMGWRLFLESLRLHLTHFRSQYAAAAAVPVAMVAGPNERAWRELCDAFAVDPAVGEGNEIVLTLGGTHWSGRVERATSVDVMRSYAFVLDGGLGTGFMAAEGNGPNVSISAYLYFYGEDADKRADAWNQAWSSSWAPPQ